MPRTALLIVLSCCGFTQEGQDLILQSIPLAEIKLAVDLTCCWIDGVG